MVRGTVDVRAIDLDSGAERTVVRNKSVGGIMPIGTDLLGNVVWSRGNGPGESKSDVFVVNRSPMQRITFSGHVEGPQLSNGNLLWEDCDGGDCGVETRPWPTGKQRHLLTAEDPMTSLGDGFFSMRKPDGPVDDVVVVPLGAPENGVALQQPEGDELGSYRRLRATSLPGSRTRMVIAIDLTSW